ncbi:hypothetical protein [Streptomyces goshikiensis]|uniref:hypothetical protein n=1 Tax=Streptomyces goshikiensis TaxID=1942 RepID=UPI0037129C23
MKAHEGPADGDGGGAKAVRERRVPEWEGVRTLLTSWNAPESGVLRGAAEQLLESPEALSEALRP